MSVLIDVQNLTKIYGQEENQTIVLNNINIKIDSGEFVAIIGPSGSGKSTLMNILGCLDKQSGGKYLLDGKTVSLLSENERAKIRNEKIGFIFQSFNLLPRTSSLKNVLLPLVYSTYPKNLREERARELLEKVGLLDKLASTPAQLSGGQQQRVAIARALVTNPSIVFADEPTGNLDTKSSGEIMEILKSLNKEGKTVIIITHEAEVASFAKRIITIRDGQIVKDTRKKGKKIKLKKKN